MDGIESGALCSWLMSKHRIVTAPIAHKEYSGLRITPNVYTTLEEVDRFAELLLHALRSGVSA